MERVAGLDEAQIEERRSWCGIVLPEPGEAIAALYELADRLSKLLRFAWRARATKDLPVDDSAVDRHTFAVHR